MDDEFPDVTDPRDPELPDGDDTLVPDDWWLEFPI